MCLSLFVCVSMLSAPAFAGGGGGDKAEDGIIKPYEYVQMDPVILPIIAHNGATQTVSLAITLELHSTKDADNARFLKPRLNDAFLTIMYGNLSHLAMKTQQAGLLNLAKVKYDLQKASKRVLGEDVKHDVLVEFLTQNKI